MIAARGRHANRTAPRRSRTVARSGGPAVRLMLLVILMLLLLGGLPTWPYSRRWGYWPSGVVGLLLVVLLLLMFFKVVAVP